jgi:malonate decarboxylase beta subunit
VIKNSFVELSARERAEAVLDKETFRELLGPYEKYKSPHLLKQEIVAQNDDGIIILKGTFQGKPAVVISMEGNFQGGGIGEISGAKFAGTLELALEDNKKGIPTQPIVLFDTGGVRLQEANYGLLAIAEIQAAIVELRNFKPLIGVIPGRIGCFGGMSMTAGLFSYLIITKEGRLTLNGPEVIEQEAGVNEFDASDKVLVWNTTGGVSRVATGYADYLVKDSVEDIINSISECISLGIPVHRSRKIEVYESLLSSINPKEKLTPQGLREHMKSLGFLEKGYTVKKEISNEKESCEDETSEQLIKGRGRNWFHGIAQKEYVNKSKINSVLCGDIKLGGEIARVITIVPDENTYYPRSKGGEIGLQQGFEIARCVWEAIKEDKGKTPRPIIAVVDSPSQAYGYKEELLGIFLSCASAVDAYTTARIKGHPVVTFIVGNAISGAFLAHGLQGSYMISLDDDTIAVHAMSKKSAARITKRSISDMDKAAAEVPAIAYDIHSFNKLGALNSLLKVSNHEAPLKEDIDIIKAEFIKGISASRENGNTLKYRLETENAKVYRTLSIQVRKKLKELW